MFLGDSHSPFDLRAAARFVLYIALVWTLWTLRNIAFEHFLPPATYSPKFLLAEEFSGLAVVCGAALILSRIERKPVGTYGLPFRQAFGKNFWQGCAFGLCEISLLIGLIAACDGYSFGTLALAGSQILRWGVVWGAIFLVVALFEEFAFRGYTLRALAQAIGFWPAAILLAIYFGYQHSHNPGESLSGEVGVVLIALVFALTLRRTGTLWLAVGWHAAFDFGETFLYSVPDSGAVFPGHLSNAYLHGPDWKTGGTAGPEASIFSFAVMGLLALAVHFLYPPKTTVPLPSPVDDTPPDVLLKSPPELPTEIQSQTPSESVDPALPSP
jgi:membrane protease YdiL (CAAX protease family)